jgi:hypothetical protein
MEVPTLPGLSAPKKQKIYSTTDVNAIGLMDPIDIDFNPPKTLRKRQRMATSGTSHLPVDVTALPPTPQPSSQPTRKSTHIAKAASKKKTKSDMFTRLRQGLHMLARTFEELAVAFE